MTTGVGTAPLLPTTLAGITPEWVTAALSERYPGTTVTSLTIGSVIQRFATNIRILLEYDQAGHRHRLPPTMFVKGAFGSHRLQPMFARAFVREVAFYRDVASQVPIDVPHCYFADVDSGAGQAIVLLEDLLARNVRFGEPARAISPAAVASGLQLLARLHAHWWDDPHLAGMEIYPGELRPVVLALFEPEHWDASIARPCGALVPEPFRTGAGMRDAVEAMWTSDRDGPHCLIHGDVHLGNSYENPDGRLGLLDWQAASAGTWAYDVTRFIAGSLTIADRRAEEQSLLRRYLADLHSCGVDPPRWEDAWLAYRRNLAHGLRWVACPPDGYPERDVAAYVERFSTAVRDLDAAGTIF